MAQIQSVQPTVQPPAGPRARGRLPLLAAVFSVLASACVNDVPAEPGSDRTSRDCESSALDSVAEIDPGCSDAFSYVTDPEHGVEGPIVDIGVDASDVYFITLDHLYQVPREGGRAERRMSRDRRVGSTFAFLWVRADDVLVYQDAKHVFRVPKRGGEPAPMDAMARLSDAKIAARTESTVVGWQLGTSSNGLTREYWAFDVESLRFRDLGAVPAPAGDDGVAVDHEAIYWTDNPARRDESTWLYKLPLSGGPERQLILQPEAERRFVLFGAAAGQLYLFASEDGAESELLGAAASSGEVVHLGSAAGHTDLTSVPQFSASEAGTVLGLRGIAPGDRIDWFWIPRGSETAAHLPCLQLPSEGPAFALDGTELFSAAGDRAGNSQIVRRKLAE